VNTVTRLRLVRALAAVLPIAVVGVSAGVAAAGDWDPITPAQLAMTKPRVDPAADVEALVWDVTVEHLIFNDEPQTHYRHYLRLKVFSERGVETTKQVEIPFDDGTYVVDVAARTIKPDGTILEVKGSDIFERTLVKAGGRKVKAKSFAVPGLVPGAIVDYRWTEHHIRQISTFIRIDLQRDVPVQEIRHHIKPLAEARELGYQMAMRWFQQRPTTAVQDSRGFTGFSYLDEPAFKEEPFMAPEYLLRRWVLIFYTETPDITPAKFWTQYAREMYEAFKPSRGIPGAVARLAATAVSDAATPAEKVARLVAACRSSVKRIDVDTSHLTSEERKKLKDNKDSGDTLKHGTGTGGDVIRLFLDLATAARLDARMAALPDGSFHPFEPGFASDFFLISRSVAVRNGEGWLFVDPAQQYLPPGMLRWQEEGQAALIADPQQPLLVATPNSPPQKSLAKREAKLRLSEDGTLEGDVREELTGHLASRAKHASDDQSETQRGEALKEEVKKRLSTAELSEIVFENVLDPDLPFVQRYHVRAPGYAQRTGKRLFLQPSFFETGAPPTFGTSARQHPIMFPYAWSEEDHVVVELPAGFSLEQPSLPQPIRSGSVASYAVTAGVVDGKSLVFDRKFHFGGQGALVYQTDAYPVLKQFFDAVHENEAHALTLAEGAAAKAVTP
jgi:hypothetical protein